MAIAKFARMALAGAILVMSTAYAAAQPMRYQLCTTGFSAFGIIDALPVYDPAGEEIGETVDLWVDREGRVHQLEINVGGLFPQAHYLAWPEVEIGETWVRALAGGSENLPGEADLLVSSAELIGSLVRTSAADGLTRFGVVDDLLVDIDSVEAVIIRPELGLGFAAKYAVPFNLLALRGHDIVQPGFDLLFEDDEVRDIGAFDC